MGDYLTIEKPDKAIYFKININSNLKYIAHGNEYFNYYVNISEFDVYDCITDFDDNYGGIYLWITEEKEIKLFDNIKKEFVNFDKMCSEENTVTFIYYSNEYSCDLEYIVKEILFNIFVKDKYY